MRPTLKLTSLATVTLLMIAVPDCPILGSRSPAIAQIPQAEKSEVDRLFEQGLQQFRQGLYQESFQTLQQVMRLRREQKNQSGEAEALTRLSEVSYWLGDSQQATVAAQAALKLWRELQNQQGEADALTRAAEAHNGEKSTALEMLQQALLLAQAADDATGEGKIRLRMGAVLLQLGQPDEALKNLQQAQTTLKATADFEESLAAAWAGWGIWSKGDRAQGLATVEAAIQLSQERENRAAEFVGLYFLAEMRSQQQAYVKALEIYQRLLPMVVRSGNRNRERNLLMNIGHNYSFLKQDQEALKHYQAALNLVKQQQAKVETPILRSEAAEALQFMGNVYSRQKQYPEALAAYQQSLKLYQAENRPQEIAQGWISIGRVYDRQKQYDQALVAYQKAQEIARSIPDRTIELDAVFWQGVAYIGQGQSLDKTRAPHQEAIATFEKAIALLQQAQVSAKELKQTQLEESVKFFLQQALLMQGITYIGQGQSLHNARAYKEALTAFENSVSSFQKAQAIAREIKDAQSEQNAILQIFLSYIGRHHIFYSQQQYAESLATLQQGLAFWRQHRDRLTPDTFLEQEQSMLQQLGNAYSYNAQDTEAVAAYQAALKIAEQRNDFQNQFYCLGSIAISYNRLGQYTKALEANQQQLALAREQLKKAPKAEMNALTTGGLILEKMGNIAAGLEHNQQALKIARDLKDVGAEARLLSNMSNLYTTQGEYLQALNVLQPSLMILESAIQRLESGQSSEVEQLCGVQVANLGAEGQRTCLGIFKARSISTLNNLVVVYHNLGRYTEALKTSQHGLAIAQQYKALYQQMVLLNNIGGIYLDMGNYPQAKENFEQALDMARDSRAQPDEATALNNLGLVYAYQGQLSKALDHHQQSLALAQAISAPATEISALNNIGTIYSDQANYAKALEFYQRSLEISRKHGLDSISPLGNIARAYQLQGRYPEALQQYQQALEIARQTGNRPAEVNLLRNLGSAYQDQADYAKAQAAYQQASELSQSFGSRSDQLTDLQVQGKLQLRLGQYAQALERFQQALTLSRELGERTSETVALGNLASVYRRQKQFSQALQLYQQALIIVRETGDVGSEITLLQEIARTYDNQGNSAQAVEFAQQALKQQQQLGIRSGQSHTLNTLGSAYTTENRFQDAQETLQQAFVIAQEMGDRETEAETLTNLGALLTQQSQPELAIVFYKQAINTYEEIRVGIRRLSREQEDSYTQSIASTYRTLADLLLAQGRVLEAQQVLELLKIQELRDYTRDTRTGGTTEGSPLNPLEQPIPTAYNDNIALGNQLTQCEQTKCAQRAQLIAQREAANDKFTALVDRLKKALRDQEIQDPAQLQSDRFTLAAQKVILANPKTKTVLIYPLVLDDKLWLVWGSQAGKSAVVFDSKAIAVSRKDLSAKVGELQTLLSQQGDPKQLQEVSQQLYQWLIAPLRKQLDDNGVQHIVFSLDRATRYIPMAALHDGNHYLIEKFAISTILTAEIDTQDKLSTNIQDDPVLGLGLTQTVSGFPALPAVKAELDGIIRAADRPKDPNGIYPGLELFDRDFTETALRQNVSDYRILHIATHGQFVPGNPEDSFLVLGDGQKLSIPTIRSITALANTHLVVLSACETGKGGIDKEGLEVAGIGHYFLLSGAKSVMASLWLVNDPATSLLMREFYSRLSQGNISKAEALRQAQLEFIQGKLTSKDTIDRAGGRRYIEGQLPVDSLAHPYYWAPFILIGNAL